MIPAIKNGASLFRSYGWDALLDHDLMHNESYRKFLDFLYESRLIFSLRGYENSFEKRAEEIGSAFKMEKNIPHFLMENQWVSWEVLAQKLRYDPIQKLILDSEGHQWNYIFPKGFVRQSRYNAIFPVYVLSDSEKEALSQHAQGNPCYVQILSSGKTPAGQIGSHVGVRLIDKEGQLYSFGFEIPTDQANLSTNSVFSVLSTYNAKITSLDFTEFKKFDRKYITTFSISEEHFSQMMQKVRTYTESHLKLNFLNHNCVDFADDLLSVADIHMDKKRSSLLQMGVEVIVPSSVIKKVSALSETIFASLKHYTPVEIQKVALAAYAVAVFVPSVFANLVKNSLFLIFGAGREGNALEGPRLADQQIPLKTWKLWDNISFSDPLKVIQWQSLQASTHSEEFMGPRIYLGIPI